MAASSFIGIDQMVVEGSQASAPSMWRMAALVAGVAIVAGLGGMFLAGQFGSRPAPAPSGAPTQRPIPQHAPLPRMQLQGLYAGPLQDTVIQRWRDPIDGTICYLYLPIAVHHTPPNETGYVEYGASAVGSIS